MIHKVSSAAAVLCLLTALCNSQSGPGGGQPSGGKPAAKPKAAATGGQSPPSTSSSNAQTENFKAVGPVSVLDGPVFGQICTNPGCKPDSQNMADFNEPYKSGDIQLGYVTQNLGKFGIDPVQDKNDNRVTIINVLRWKDSKHTSVVFQKWYVYDPNGRPKDNFYFKSAQQLFESATIAGRKNFRLVTIHFDSVFLDYGNFLQQNRPASGAGDVLLTGDESVQDGCLLAQYSTDGSVTLGVKPTPPATACLLKYPVSYQIVVTKQQTQFMQDLTTVLGIIGFPTSTAGGAGAERAVDEMTRENLWDIGYWSTSEFTSQYSTSSIKVSPTLDAATAKIDATSQPKTNQAANQLAPNTYTNEGPTHWGLSFAVPVTSYKDVTYQSSSGTLVPGTITQQSVYVNLDFYYPAVLPSLAQFRWIPHPFGGLPIKGKVLQHTTAGIAFGSKWVEPFVAVVFDRQNSTVNNSYEKTTFKTIYGIKVSPSAVAKALKK